MRLITTFTDGQKAQKFSHFLEKERVENTLDMQIDRNTKEISYSVWVHNEDQISLARDFLEHFQHHPNDKKYDLPPPPPVEDPIKPVAFARRQYPFFWTSLIFVICVGLFLLNGAQAIKMAHENKGKAPFITSVMKWCLFDEPTFQIKVAKVDERYPPDLIEKNPQLKAQKQQAYEDLFKKNPAWMGIYPIIVNKILYPKEKVDFAAPLFVKIREAQVWRLITPIFLHGGILHILFNMLWLWFLGKQIEPRLSSFRYLLLILITGVVSNVAQYLMSGPLFLGYSGVVIGNAGFIWSRQKVAPWEGYPIQKRVFLFIGAYIVGLFILQMISFLLLFFGQEFLYGLQIANTAHITGGLVGLLLGRLSFFRWRSHE